MKTFGYLALLLGAAFLCLVVYGWRTLIVEHGFAGGLRAGFAHWPSIVAVVISHALVVVFVGIGFSLLGRK